jgi:phosphatidylglycerophosphatase A
VNLAPREPASSKTRADRVHLLLITGCGLGLAPVASGSFGSLGGVAVAVALQLAFGAATLTAAFQVAALMLLVYGCSTTAFTERMFRAKDPGAFVLDEVAGYLFALSIWSAVWGVPTVAAHSACFFLFRLFDVLKVYPANRLERIAGAPGIMLDDVMAGVYAGIAMVAIWRVAAMW